MEQKRSFEKNGKTINVISASENDVIKIETEIRTNKFGRAFIYATVNDLPDYLVNLTPNQAKQLTKDQETASIIGKKYKAYAYTSAKFPGKKFLSFAPI